jgi:enoyl-[acyl-carrier protein] reductase II
VLNLFKTKSCDLLNIIYLILQGGMAWVATGELAAAVPNTGGPGIIGAGNPAKQIKKIKNINTKIIPVRRLIWVK